MVINWAIVLNLAKRDARESSLMTMHRSPSQSKALYHTCQGAKNTKSSSPGPSYCSVTDEKSVWPTGGSAIPAGEVFQKLSLSPGDYEGYVPKDVPRAHFASSQQTAPEGPLMLSIIARLKIPSTLLQSAMCNK